MYLQPFLLLLFSFPSSLLTPFEETALVFSRLRNVLCVRHVLVAIEISFASRALALALVVLYST